MCVAGIAQPLCQCCWPCSALGVLVHLSASFYYLLATVNLVVVVSRKLMHVEVCDYPRVIGTLRAAGLKSFSWAMHMMSQGWVSEPHLSWPRNIGAVWLQFTQASANALFMTDRSYFAFICSSIIWALVHLGKIAPLLMLLRTSSNLCNVRTYGGGASVQ